MREHLTAQSLAAELMMTRSADPRVLFVVEGESDVRSIKGSVDKSECVVVQGNGRVNVTEAMRILAEREFDEAVALVDRDFGHWLREELPSNVVTTTLCDLEADVFLVGGLLADFLDASGCSERRDAFETAAGSGLLEFICRAASMVGQLRWVSISNELNLRLAGFPFGADGLLTGSGEVSRSGLIDIALNRTEDCDVSKEEIEALWEIPLPTTDRRDRCNGHDLVAVISASARHWAARPIGKKEVMTFLSAALRCDVLRQLGWYHELDSWARARGRRIWACDV